MDSPRPCLQKDTVAPPPGAEQAQPGPAAALSRRSFLRAAGLAGAGAALAACSPARPSASARTEQKIQLVYQDWPTGWFPPMAQQALEEFHAAHPNIRVYYVPDPENPNYQQKVTADMEAGTMADVFEGCCTQFPIWAQQGYCLDLRPYVAADLDKETVADWDPVQYQSFFNRDGRQFGLPKYHGALALYYNKDLFRAARLDFPDETWNHDDYLTAMKRLTVPDAGHWGSMLELIWERIQVHVNGFGGHFVDPENPRRSRLADPNTLAGFRWLRDAIWEQHCMPTSAQVHNLGTREAFVGGFLGMVEDGSWALKDILTGAKFDVGVAPFPAGPVRRATLTSTDGFGIYSRTRHPDAAWELVKFLISKNYGRAMARAAFLQPARASLLDEWAGYVRAEFPDKAKDLDIAAFAHGHIHNYSVTTEIFANMSEATQLITPAWEQIFTFGQAPVELMIDVSHEVESAQSRVDSPVASLVSSACQAGCRR